MCDLSEAFLSLLHKPTKNVRTDIFSNKWYSYEAEQDFHHKAKDTLDTILPKINVNSVPTIQCKKTKHPFDKSTEFLFSHLFKEWSTHDLLVTIIIFQLFLFITIAVK